MYDNIVSKLRKAHKVENVETRRESPKRGTIFFGVTTDDTFEKNLKGFQPENSTIFVEDGRIEELHLRIGSFGRHNKEETMDTIRDIVTNAREEHCVPPADIHRGGMNRFVPHVRICKFRVAEETLPDFIDSVIKQVESQIEQA